MSVSSPSCICIWRGEENCREHHPCDDSDLRLSLSHCVEARGEHMAILIRHSGPDPTTRCRAIRARCLNCKGWENTPVRECEITDCNLWPYRLGKSPNRQKSARTRGQNGIKIPSRAIADHCLACSGNSVSERRQCPATECPLWAFRNGRKEGKSSNGC